MHPLYYYANGMNMTVQGSDATAFFARTRHKCCRVEGQDTQFSLSPLYSKRKKSFFGRHFLTDFFFLLSRRGVPAASQSTPRLAMRQTKT